MEQVARAISNTPSVNDLGTFLIDEDIDRELINEVLRLLAHHYCGSHSPLLTVREIARDNKSGIQPSYIADVIYPCDHPTFANGVSKYGSFTAFHGTRIDNVFSILQNGLQNLSGTKHMKQGNIFGDGIYLAQDLSVAFSFASSNVRSIWPQSAFVSPQSHRIHVSAVLQCEVVNKEEYILSDPKKANAAYIVVTNELHVRVRKILLFR
jgi:hypothetical protein